MTRILRTELARLTHEEIVEILCKALRESLDEEAPGYSFMLSEGTLTLHIDKAVTKLEQLAKEHK